MDRHSPPCTLCTILYFTQLFSLCRKLPPRPYASPGTRSIRLNREQVAETNHGSCNLVWTRKKRFSTILLILSVRGG